MPTECIKTLCSISLDTMAALLTAVGTLILLGIAIYTLVINKNAIFRNTLHNKQLGELEVIRRTLYDILSNICDVNWTQMQLRVYLTLKRIFLKDGSDIVSIKQIRCFAL